MMMLDTGHIYSMQGLLAETSRVQQIPGIAVATKRGDNISFYNYGYTDLNQTAPINEDTFFYIASLSKSFTALAVLLLYHWDYICLTDPITKHLPWLNFRYRARDFSVEELQIRHLLHHSSGLTNLTHAVRILPTDHEDSLYEAVRSINNSRLNFRPGSQSAYGSCNYIILGLLIDRFAFINFEEMIEFHILRPLNLTNTKMYRADAQNAGIKSNGHRPRWFGTQTHTVSIARSHTPTGFMLSTARDLIRWLGFHVNPESAPYPLNILIPKMHIADTSVVHQYDQNRNPYFFGKGWYVYHRPIVGGGHNVEVRHPGFGPNVVSEGWASENGAIVVLMNSSGGVARNLRRNISLIQIGGRSHYIEGGSVARTTDTIFSASSIWLMGLMVAFAAIVIKQTIGIVKKKAIFKKPKLKQIILSSILAALVLVTVILSIIGPAAFGLGSWAAVAIWSPPSVYTLFIFLNLSIFFSAAGGILSMLFPKIETVETVDNASEMNYSIK